MRKFLVLISLLAMFLVFVLSLTPTWAGDPVNFRELIPFVKLNLPGWGLQGEPQGQTVKTPQMTMTEVEAHYVSGSKNLSVKIIDSSLGQSAYTGMGFLQGMEVDTSEETTRGATVNNFPAVETFRHQDKEARLTILVGGRLLVVLEGSQFEGVKELIIVAEQMDLAKLAALTAK